MTIFFSSSTPLVTVTEIGLHNSGNFPKVPRVFRNPCLEEGGDKQKISESTNQDLWKTWGLWASCRHFAMLNGNICFMTTKRNRLNFHRRGCLASSPNPSLASLCQSASPRIHDWVQLVCLLPCMLCCFECLQFNLSSIHYRPGCQ